MLPLVMAAAALAPMIGGAIGNAAAQGDRSHANDAMFNYLNSVNALQTPELDKLKATLSQYQNAGNYTPDKESDVLLSQQDAMQNINIDPRLKQAQMDQLASLQKLNQSGGMDPMMQAQQNASRNQAAADQQAKMQQMLEDQQRRGMGSSDASMAARLISSQGAANRRSQESQQAQSDAFQRMLQAGANAGTLAGNMNANEFTQQQAIANALNAREAARVSQQSGTQQRNIDRANTAMQGNVDYARNISKGNTDIKNQENLQHVGAAEQDYQNRLAKMGLMQGASTGVSNTLNKAADATAAAWAGAGAGAGKALGGFNMMGGGGAGGAS